MTGDPHPTPGAVASLPSPAAGEAVAPLDAAAFAAAVRRRLDALAAAGRRVAFWWRDDDAVAATPALDRLIAIAEAHGVPLALAAIPARAEASLAARLAGAPTVAVLQHGFAHANHEPAGSRAAELGGARPADAVLAELDDGRCRLAGLVGDRLLPVLVPPWNRIAPEIAARRREAGLTGLSTFTARTIDDHRLDAHLDPIAWKTTRGFAGFEKMLRVLDEELAARAALAGGATAASVAPIGLLTHHLAHDEAVWTFTAAFVAAAANHPAADWPAIDAAFGLG